MRKFIIYGFSWCILVGVLVSTSGCFLRPYHVDIQQGNVLEQKDIAKISEGMTKNEVRSILGTPMLRNTFDDSCWTYVYTMQKNGGKIQERELTLHFSGSTLTHIDKLQTATVNTTKK